MNGIPSRFRSRSQSMYTTHQRSINAVEIPSERTIDLLIDWQRGCLGEGGLCHERGLCPAARSLSVADPVKIPLYQNFVPTPTTDRDGRHSLPGVQLQHHTQHTHTNIRHSDTINSLCLHTINSLCLHHHSHSQVPRAPYERLPTPSTKAQSPPTS